MENFVVSARKYRPATFKTVVGQDTIVQTLKNAIRNNSLAQAFLFTGPRGIGKTTCARILAKTINCLNLQPDTEPCNECESCRSFNQLASFNIQELDAASNNSVDDIRTLVDQVRIPPQAGKYKVYIIDEVHMLSSNAFNAFLKTLEEPPAYAKFILATTERHKILPTILSRCQIYDFKRISVTDIAKHLAWVAGQEGLTFEEEALHVIAQKADGALRDALSIFDQIVSFSGNHIKYQDVIGNLNLLDYEYYFRIMEKIRYQDVPGALLLLNEIINQGFDGHHFISGLGEHLRNLLLCKDVSIAGLLEASDSVKSRYQEQSGAFSMVWLVTSLDLVSKADISYRTATNKRLHLELLLLQMVKIEGFSAPDNTPSVASESARAESSVAEQEKPSVVVTSTPPSVKPDPVPAATTSSAGHAAAPPLRAEAASPQNHQGAESVPETTPHHPEKEQLPKPEGVPQVGKRRMSIREMLDDAEKGKDDDEEEQLHKPNREILPLNVEEVGQYIREYSDQIRNQHPSFAVALIEKPVMVEEDNKIVITFSNKVSADPGHLKNLRSFLRSRLQEPWFTLEPLIVENLQPEKVILSPRDKFNRMKEKSPNLDQMIKKLGLEFEE